MIGDATTCELTQLVQRTLARLHNLDILSYTDRLYTKSLSDSETAKEDR
jgi:hypothetical protein